MRNPISMRRASRLIAGAFVLCFAGLLGGCSSLSMPAWDPTDMLDFLDTKKKAPGERKPVFPEGVPGISQGVPKEMVRGSAESRASAEGQSIKAANLGTVSAALWGVGATAALGAEWVARSDAFNPPTWPDRELDSPV